MSSSIVPLKREREDSDYESGGPEEEAGGSASDHDTDAEDLPDDEVEVEDQSDSDEEMDDWDPSESRYDASEESMPKVPAYHLAFTKAQQEVENLLISFPDVTQYILFDETLDELKDMRQEAWDNDGPAPVKIALLGEAGKGKSSLINSILDTPDLADTGASGQSCTNVVFEYACAPSTQQAAFGAHVVYHTPDKIKQFLGEQIKNYRHAAFDSREDWTEEEKFENGLLKKTARELFHEVFCHHQDFRTIAATHVWFQNTKDERVETIVDRLSKLAAEIIQALTGDARGTILTADTGAALRKMLAPYAKTREKRQANVGRAIWPLVESIKISIKGARVVENVILVDMPGIRFHPSKIKAGVLRKRGKGDSNRFRDGLSYDYLKNCNGAWVVTELARALDEANVKRMLKDTFDLFSSLDSANVALICTHSDVKIDGKTTTDLKSKKFDVAEVALWDRSLKDDRKKEKELTKAIEKKQHHTTQHKMKAELQELQERIKEVEIKKKAKLISLRNIDVQQRAAKAFKDHVPSGVQLNVFCVSNDEYKKWKHPDSSENHTMDIEVTGIPAVRAFLRERAAPRVQRHFELRIGDTVPSLIDTTKLWCIRAPVENADEIIQTAIEPQQSVEETVNRLFVDRNGAFEKVVLHDIDEAQDVLTSKAVTVHSGWRPRSGPHKSRIPGWNNQTYAAWYRHSGCYETKTQKYISWHEEITKELSKTLESPWKLFDDQRMAKGEAAVRFLQGLLDDVPFKIRKMQILLPGKPNLDRIIKQAGVALENIFHLENERQIRFVSHMWTQTVKEVPDGYVLQFMKPIYADAREVRGRGIALKVFEMLGEHLQKKGDHNLWTDVMTQMATSLADDANLNKERLAGEVTKVYKRVEKQVRIMVEDKEKEEREDPRLTKIRGDLHAWAMDGAAKLEQIKTQVNLAKEACGVDGA